SCLIYIKRRLPPAHSLVVFLPIRSATACAFKIVIALAGKTSAGPASPSELAFEVGAGRFVVGWLFNLCHVLAYKSNARLASPHARPTSPVYGAGGNNRLLT